MANKFFTKLDSELAGTGSKYKLPDAEPAGFWARLWHGVLLPITFIASLL